MFSTTSFESIKSLVKNKVGPPKVSLLTSETPGGPNGAQEAQMEPRRPNWSSGGSNGAQEAQTPGPNPSSIA